VLEETGRTLTASPLLATATATVALLLGGSEEQKKKWLPKVAEGKAVGTLAVDEAAHHAPEKVALKAEKSGSGYKLSGQKVFVMEGGAADFIVVAARTSGKPGDKNGITLFVVEGNAPGLTREKLKSVDSRGIANLTFKDVSVGADAVLGAADNGFGVLEATLDRARAILAAEMLGHAVQSFETTLDYLKTRVQFGQPIGSFQALQHRAVDMFVETELAKSTNIMAAIKAGDPDPSERAYAISQAKVQLSVSGRFVTQQAIQLHGGIGVTDEHDVGLYFKRMHVLNALFGDEEHHVARFTSMPQFTANV